MTFFVQVALDVPLDGAFDYTAEQVSAADVGRRVVVPFGNRKLVGIILGVSAQPSNPEIRHKAIIAILEDMPALPVDVLAMLRFCSAYYHHPLGQVIQTALPTRLRDPAPFKVVESLNYQLRDAAALKAMLPARAVMQHRLATFLSEPRTEDEIRALSPGAWKLVQSWLIEKVAYAVKQHPPIISASGALQLNADQAAAVEGIASSAGFAPALLMGITGSGKTEVYLQAIASMLAKGKQILILVPEINLTPQLEARFRARFAGIALVSLHSSVADGDRAQGWMAAARGDARIVLGTRLAVFTPMPSLGLIVVDEEHDASFKQQEGLRYSARDMAVWRANQRNVPIVLGSATPSLETWHNVRTEKYRLHLLRERAVSGAKPPQISLVNTRRQSLVEGLHPGVLQAIRDRVARKEQVLVFINRRGYAPVVHCGECGWMAACTRCAARLTVHLRERTLRCHHCGLEERLPARCPGCGNQDVRPVGQGTQRIEEFLSSQFAHAKVIRIDRDSTRRKGSFEAALEDIHEGRADILIGTQMLAKGHDFPNLTLVVVVGADSGLFSADYRAAERMYALLAQVAGRSGRGDKPGTVLIQTDFSDHPLFQSLIRDDYASFADAELAQRQTAQFPPVCAQAILRADALVLADALAFLRQALALAPVTPGIVVYDPVEASMVRLANRERAQVLVQSSHRGALRTWLAQWMHALRQVRHAKVRWSLDVDPLEV
ncbi:primosomal protein N' [Burkholderiaceae bacterium DAT-1]|nr:primosomal protein N' [Burkholderiaceae bacterium DAT-1]